MIFLLIFYRLYLFFKIRDILNKTFVINCKSSWINHNNKKIYTKKFVLNLSIKYSFFKTKPITILCYSKNSNSISFDVNYNIFKNNIILNYNYSNEINPKTREKFLHNHQGKAYIKFINNNISDFYYSNNDVRRISWLEEYQCIN